MRQLYFIREKNTNTWCSSAKHSQFYEDFDNASVYLSDTNAEKAIKDMIRGLDPKKSSWPAWRCNGDTYIGIEEGNLMRFPLLVPDFEIVAFDLVERVL